MINKNDEIICNITGYTSSGDGVAKYEGFPLFIPATIIGETVKVKVLKKLKNYAFCKLVEVITPSKKRVEPICSSFPRCGGCSLMHMNYNEQLNLKKIKVSDAMKKIGGFDNIVVHDTSPSPKTTEYRNKVSVPVSTGASGAIWGYYAVNSHRVIESSRCFLQDNIVNKLINTITSFMDEFNILPYNEETCKGTVRHIYIRKTAFSGEIMVSVVSAKPKIKYEEILCERLLAVSNSIKSIIININSKKTNVILGDKNRVLYGNEYICDTLLDTNFKINHHSFYQVNSYTTEILYSKAISLLGDLKNKTVFDLYCGIGTISLLIAKSAKKVYGIEFVKAATDDAYFNAEKNGIANVEFYPGDAAEEILKLANRGIKPDYIVLDPPRKGCDKEVLNCAASLSPEKIVYVSCDCATLARDMKHFETLGYKADEVFPFDMFPQTAHVESVALLSRLKPDDVLEVELKSEDLHLTSAEVKATYQQIKDFIFRKHGFKVSSLYIAQVKQKLGLPMGKNYNTSKKGTKVPICPLEKEKVIKDALKHFKMV